MEVFEGDGSSSNSLDPGTKKSSKRWVIIVLLVIILIGGGLLWYLITQPDETTEQQPQETTIEPVEVNDTELNNFVYGFGTSFESAANIFVRELVDDSERISSMDLANIGEVPFNTFASNLMGFQTSNKYIVIKNEKELWMGDANQDGALVYTHAEASSANRVVAAVVSRNGSKVAFAVSNDLQRNASLWLLDVATVMPEKLLDDIKTAPFMFSADNKRIYLGPNVFNGDGQQEIPSIVDIASKSNTPLFGSSHPYDFGAYMASVDGRYVAYVMATADESRRDPSSFQGYYVGKPYTLMLKDLTNNETQEIEVIDSDTPPMSLAFDQTGSKLYWSEGTKLFERDIASGSTIETYDTTDNNIDIVYAVSGSSAVVGSRLPDRTYVIYVVDLANKDRFQLMETTDATSAVGFLID